MATFFNEYFGVTVDQVDDHGAFNVSIINDLPLFIDPFLLFNSGKPEYQQLHNGILKYIVFLRDVVTAGRITPDLEKAWFLFPEVKQNWLGFSLQGNGGSGLGRDFAAALRTNLGSLFANFGKETITRGSHIEKVCLVSKGVGRDMISDFTTNLVKDYLCKYTEDFAVSNIDPALRKKVWVNKARFNYETESWERGQYDLPWLENDFVLLTPKDMLTRDENWINRRHRQASAGHPRRTQCVSRRRRKPVLRRMLPALPDRVCQRLDQGDHRPRLTQNSFNRPRSARP